MSTASSAPCYRAIGPLLPAIFTSKECVGKQRDCRTKNDKHGWQHYAWAMAMCVYVCVYTQKLSVTMTFSNEMRRKSFGGLSSQETDTL